MGGLKGARRVWEGLRGLWESSLGPGRAPGRGGREGRREKQQHYIQKLHDSRSCASRSILFSIFGVGSRALSTGKDLESVAALVSEFEQNSSSFADTCSLTARYEY